MPWHRHSTFGRQPSLFPVGWPGMTCPISGTTGSQLQQLQKSTEMTALQVPRHVAHQKPSRNVLYIIIYYYYTVSQKSATLFSTITLVFLVIIFYIFVPFETGINALQGSVIDYVMARWRHYCNASNFATVHFTESHVKSKR